jgi:GH15 family glucan-1,4-alpha-glucosidase
MIPKFSQTEFWSGALMGLLTGIASLVSLQYFSRILREPRLVSRALFSGEDEFESREKLALLIAAEGLQLGIRTRYLTRDLNKKVLHAGYRNFRESWARDFGFASFGLTAVEQHEVIRDTLEAFFWHQKPNGQLPVKLHSMNIMTRFFHSLFEREQPTHKILEPKYKSAHGSPSLDGQALLVIAALHYGVDAEDTEFLREYWQRIERAVKWLSTHRKEDGLLQQEAYTDWADSVARTGCVLYTNVVYWKALMEMSVAAASLDYKNEATQFATKAEDVFREIHERLWRPDLGYFATSDKLDNLSSDGNLLAIAWGLTKPDQAQSILDVMEETRMAEPVPTRVVVPSYPRQLIAVENRLGGLPNYHTDSSWLWLGAWHLIALTRTGRMEEAGRLMERIVDVVVRDRQVHEVHGPDGQPLSSAWYKSEAPLTWNAGMILHAARVLEERQREDMDILSILQEKLA